MEKETLSKIETAPDATLEASYGEDDFIDKKIERSYIWKLDLIVLPILGLMEFTSALDRANLGNAKTDMFEQNIGLKSNQYSLILVLFYIPYGMLSIPATILAKRYSPAVVIPVFMFCWGATSLAHAAVKNFGGILSARIVLGVFEAGFFPSAIYYCTLFYTRHEIAQRISFFYMMGFVATAFSGLIAYRVFQWHDRLYNWQYLFIIEGSITMALSLISLIVLPRNIASSRYFNAAEKRVAMIRQARETKLGSFEFSWYEVLNPLWDWHIWAYAFIALFYGVALASIGNFLPTIIKRLTIDTVKANLFTIAPDLCGGLFIVLICYISDRTQIRAWFAIGSIAISCIGFITLGTADLVKHTAAGYFCTFLLTCGSYTPAVLIPAWMTSNTVSITGRATALGMIAGMQNIAGIISSEAFRTQDAPIYGPALIVSGVFQGAMIVAVLGLYLYYRHLNRMLDSGKLTSVRGMENNKQFRYVL